MKDVRMKDERTGGGIQAEWSTSHQLMPSGGFHKPGTRTELKGVGAPGATFRVKGRMSRSVRSNNFHATIAQAPATQGCWPKQNSSNRL
jgi:hypothetical protein